MSFECPMQSHKNLQCSRLQFSAQVQQADKHADINALITWLDITKAHSTPALSTTFNPFTAAVGIIQYTKMNNFLSDATRYRNVFCYAAVT